MSIDSHIKIAGIEGEAEHKDHKNEIELESWSWGVSNASNIAGGGSGKGKAEPGDFSFTHKVDKASPNLAKFCVTGKHVAEATLSCAKSGEGQKEFLKIVFKEVKIISVQAMGSAGGDLMESVSFSYGDVEQTYKSQNDKGAMAGDVKFGWNVKTTDTR